MLFSDITDCEMLVYRCIQEADKEIGLVGIMDELEKKYQKDWKRSTVCTFIAHLIEKGYVNGRREDVCSIILQQLMIRSFWKHR